MATNTSEANRFFGVSENSVKMTSALPHEEVFDIQNTCMQLIVSPKTTIIELTKLLGKPSFISKAVLPGRIQCKYFQQQQIQAVKQTNSYQTKIKLSQQSIAELTWWKENLFLQNGKPLTIGMPQLIIQMDASKTSWGGSLSGKHHGGNLVISGKDKAYQCSGAHCSETCNIDLYQRKIGNSNPLINRQYDSSFLLGKIAANLQLRTATSSQRNMGLSVNQSSSSYSRVLTKQLEYLGRFKRLEIEPQNIFSDCENQRNTSNRPQNESSVTKIHVLASRLRQLFSILGETFTGMHFLHFA